MGWTAPDGVQARLPHGAGRHRLEAGGRALPQRAIEGVGQVEEPGERGGAAGARGAVALVLHREKQHDGEHSDAEDDHGPTGYLGEEIPS